MTRRCPGLRSDFDRIRVIFVDAMSLVTFYDLFKKLVHVSDQNMTVVVHWHSSLLYNYYYENVTRQFHYNLCINIDYKYPDKNEKLIKSFYFRHYSNSLGKHKFNRARLSLSVYFTHK